MIGRETEGIKVTKKKKKAVRCPEKYLNFGALYLSSSISLTSEVTLNNLYHFS